MSDDNKIRLAHELLDEINARQDLTPEQTEVLRSFLPELPKQKTLEEITAHVYDAWLVSSDYEFNGNEYDPDVTIEDWLLELHKQLRGLKDAPAAVPALPAGMRLAEHEKYGRCVVSPKPDAAGVCDVMHIDNSRFVGSRFEWAHECELTFIDAEPAHPEFLETEEDYENAPQRTIVAIGTAAPWIKLGAVWESAVSRGRSSDSMGDGFRRVLRWGTGES